LRTTTGFSIWEVEVEVEVEDEVEVEEGAGRRSARSTVSKYGNISYLCLEIGRGDEVFSNSVST
jgi:hypothetical protein